MPEAERRELVFSLPPHEQMAMLFAWRDLWARPEQIAPPGDWIVWTVLAGRGFGKTRTGAEFVREEVEAGRSMRPALVAPTVGDYRRVMVEGESGILAVSRPDFMPIWEPSNYQLTWPNGAVATCYSAEKPDRLRGPQHDLAWADEVAAWKYGPDTWDNLNFGLRLGDSPRICVTTTPRPVRLMRQILRDEGTVITGGSTYDNAANLAGKFLRTITRKYQGTTLGRQELFAEMLSEMPGALWTRAVIERLRVEPDQVPMLSRIVIAIDPAVSSGDEADETGIIVAGLGIDGHAYVLYDGSLRASPDTWARRAVMYYEHYHADRITAEVNNGGEMVELTLRTVAPNIPYRAIHASRGKISRAEPVSALYEQGRVHHLRLPDHRDPETGILTPVFEDLEDQMCTYVRGAEESPDRMDALVYAITELMLDEDATEMLAEEGEDYEIARY